MSTAFRPALLPLLLLLCSCSGQPEHSASREQKMAERRAKAERLAKQPPKRIAYRFDNGELVVIDIATVGDGGLQDSQKCFLWRDAEFKAASLQCPSTATGDLPDSLP
jgi:hypothetical protein